MHSFFHEYWSILTDPAHVAVELTLTLVIDGLLLGLTVPAIKRYVKKEHKEHGLDEH